MESDSSATASCSAAKSAAPASFAAVKSDFACSKNRFTDFFISSFNVAEAFSAEAFAFALSFEAKLDFESSYASTATLNASGDTVSILSSFAFVISASTASTAAFATTGSSFAFFIAAAAFNADTLAEP